MAIEKRRYIPSVDSCATTKDTAGEDVDILAPPERIAVLEHGFYGMSTAISSTPL